MAVAASKLQLADSTQHCCWSVATLLEYTYFSKEIKQLVQKARSPTFYTFSLNSDNPQLCNTSFICTFITCEIAQLYLPPLLCFAAFECRVEQILHFASHYLLCCLVIFPQFVFFSSLPSTGVCPVGLGCFITKPSHFACPTSLFCRVSGLTLLVTSTQSPQKQNSGVH